MDTTFAPVRPTLVKDAEKAPAWMSVFATKPLPSFQDLSREVQLPAVVPVSLSRSALAAGDTVDGTLMGAAVPPAQAQALSGDPRVAQVRRMLARDAAALRMSVGPEPRPVLEALPPPQDPRFMAEAVTSKAGEAVLRRNNEIPGRIAFPDPREMDAPSLVSFTREAIKSRAAQLPAALRARMEQMGAVLDTVRDARRAGVGSDRAALAATADIAERAFVVSEAAKSPEQRAKEAKEGKVDPLFAASATATRAASREGMKEAFMSRGLVSDVVAFEAGQRAAKGMPQRADGDWVSTAQRLKRLGLIDAQDPRGHTKPEPVVAKMAKTEAERVKDEGKAISDVFRDPAQAARQAKDAVQKQDELRVDIKHARPPEATADNSVTQIGWSGQYYTQEVARDNQNASMANKLEADIRARHEKAANAVTKTAEDKAGAQFARAGLVEGAAVKAHGMGLGSSSIKAGFETAAATANIGLTEVAVASRASATITKSKSRVGPEEGVR
jgi:hypothetical protein